MLTLWSSTGLLPLWMFTLGRQVYAKTTTAVPVRDILTTLVTMSVCLSVGLAFQRFFPRVAAVSLIPDLWCVLWTCFDHVFRQLPQYCKKLLAPISVAMIIFIVVFGTYANLYMFRLINARILWSAGLCVWIGFLGGYLVSLALRFPVKDRTAISIETGIQNTGIAIVLLGLSLPPPFNDISTVVPVAASIMTPIPLTIIYISMKLVQWYKKRRASQSILRSVDANGSNNSSSSTLISPDGSDNSKKRNDRKTWWNVNTITHDNAMFQLSQRDLSIYEIPLQETLSVHRVSHHFYVMTDSKQKRLSGQTHSD